MQSYILFCNYLPLQFLIFDLRFMLVILHLTNIMDHILLPSFWVEKPALWFAQVEAVFALNRVTTDSDMYDYIISELNNDVISLVEDIILDYQVIESANDKYDNLKQKIIQRLSIQQLENEKIGSMKPSEFLAFLQTKADSRVSETTVRGIWFDGLPSHAQEVLKGLQDFRNLELLTKVADKIVEANLVEKPSDRCLSELEGKLDMLLQQMDNLHKQMVDIQATIQEKVEVYNNCKCKAPVVILKRNDQKLNEMCWYHKKFGYRAVKCIHPCSFIEQEVTQKL